MGIFSVHKAIKHYFLLMLIFASTNLFSQQISTLSRLPAKIDETSGIEETGPNQIWTFNDSGGQAELYLCDTLGSLQRTIKITNAWNRDWEDITKDDQGNFYIGNIGNNDNTNTDLCIFKITDPNTIEKDEATAEIITYRYEDQYLFPPHEDSLDFDCEAMIWYKQHIYLFTKHRSLPMATNLYRIPDTPGNHIAKKIDTFYTGTASKGEYKLYDYWVTAGDISPDGSMICLLSGNKLWLFYDFEDDRFFSGKHRRINLPASTQKEAICFISNQELYITDEYWKFRDIGRNLYKVKFSLED